MKQNGWKRKVAAVLAVSALGMGMLLAGCGGDKSAAPAHDKTAAIAYMGTRSEPRMGFDPLKGFANPDGVSIFQSNLIRMNGDLSIEKEFAKDYKISDDGLTYTFDLRDDVKCSDGELLTAEDVKFTFETAAKNAYVGNLQDIDHIDTPSKTQVVFHMKKPNSLFIYTIARLPIVPKHAYKDGYGQNPVGSGPYKMVQWDKGQQMIVEANPYFFKGTPKLKKITFLFVGAEAALQAAKSGKIDVYEVPYNYVETKIPDSRMMEYKSAGKFTVMLPVTKPGEVTDNPNGREVGNLVTSDIAVRKALNYGIDRQAIVQNLMKGHGAPAYGVVDPEMPYYNQDTSYKDNDVEKAKQILADAGWKDTNGNGIVDKDGQEAEVIIMADAADKMLQNVAMLLSDQAKRFGVGIKLDAKSPDEMLQRQHKDLKLINYGSLDPMNIYFLYYGPNSGKGFYNMTYFNNSTVNGYIEKAMEAPNADIANDYWKKAQWDGQTGFSVRGDPSILWLVNKNYMYQVKNGFDLGDQQSLQPGSMGWAIARNIQDWGWRDGK